MSKIKLSDKLLDKHYVKDVKSPNSILTYKNNLLKIGAKATFKKTFQKIKKSSKEFVWVLKPSQAQMSAVLLARLLGKKFLWIQNFENPPVPNFFTRLLLNQVDEILVSSRAQAKKLHALGVDRPKIKLTR